MTGKYQTTIWQRYEIDPLDLIGKAVRLTVIKRVNPMIGKPETKLDMTYYFGTVQTIIEPRGLDTYEESDDWVEDAFSAYFDQEWPNVTVLFEGDARVEFDPQRDAVSFQWVTDDGGEQDA